MHVKDSFESSVFSRLNVRSIHFSQLHGSNRSRTDSRQGFVLPRNFWTTSEVLDFSFQRAKNPLKGNSLNFIIIILLYECGKKCGRKRMVNFFFRKVFYVEKSVMEFS